MDKSPEAFRTISEVADELDLPQHVLRFWETRFSTIRPLKRGGGRRYYRPDDVDLLKGIRNLLYGQGYTIKGVQRILKQDGLRFVQALGRGEETRAPSTAPMADDADPAATVDPNDMSDGRFDVASLDMLAPVGQSGAGDDPGPTILPSSAVAALEGALAELLECRRILRTLRNE